MATVSFNNITESSIDTNGKLITNTLNGTGHFDVLMKALRAHVKAAVSNQEITQAEAGSVYTGVIPSLVAEAVRFELGVGMANIQISNEKAKNSALLAESIAKLDKEMGYGNAEVANGTEEWYTDAAGVVHYYEQGTVILGDPDIEGMIDKQTLEVVASTERNNADATATLGIKYQQELAEKIKNGEIGLEYTYTYTDENGDTWTGQKTQRIDLVVNRKGTITGVFYLSSDTYNTIPIYEAQKGEIVSKTYLTNEQKAQVENENRILGNKT